ncbi:MAG: type II secretion system protein [Clostridia bacterium]|nr:type II secretion system protein [Clostridia bacterium]
MKNTNKKGFTIVELVIVIAVIAILAAVLIPTFAGLVAKANLSADKQMIRNMNTNLAMYEATGEDKDISGVMAYLRSNGFSYEKMVPYSKGDHYCYSKESNQFYLLDNKNAVVYPENADVTLDKLWTVYNDHATSMVEGITHYYAVDTIDSQVEFDSAFANGTYTLDLNKNLCTVNGNANVTVTNGTIIGTGFAGSEGATTVSASNTTNTVEEKDDAGKFTKITYTNVLNPVGIGQGSNSYADGVVLEYVNCVFTNYIAFSQVRGNAANITFTNCTFVNIGGFAIILQPENEGVNASTVTIDGCEFINCERGIHVSDWENTTVNITNSTFALKTGSSAYNCVQISNYDSGDYESDPDIDELAGLKINFTNNNVASANGVVYFHDGMTGPQNIDTFKGVLNFSGNTYGKNVVKVADRNEYKSGHFLYNNAEAMAALAELVK